MLSQFGRATPGKLTLAELIACPGVTLIQGSAFLRSLITPSVLCPTLFGQLPTAVSPSTCDSFKEHMPEEPIHHPNDKLLKATFSNPDNARGFFQNYLPTQISRAADWNSLRLES